MSRVVALVAVFSMSMWGLQSQNETEDLDAAIQQVRQGAFEDAVLALDRITRSLAQVEGARVDLAKAYTYLSPAFLGLAQEDRARAAFVHALSVVPDLQISDDEFPPKFAEFFRMVATEVASASEPAPATPEPTPATVAAVEESRGGGSKALLVIGGLAAAGGGSRPGGGAWGGSHADADQKREARPDRVEPLLPGGSGLQLQWRPSRRKRHTDHNNVR